MKTLTSTIASVLSQVGNPSELKNVPAVVARLRAGLARGLRERHVQTFALMSTFQALVEDRQVACTAAESLHAEAYAHLERTRDELLGATTVLEASCRLARECRDQDVAKVPA